MGVYLRHVAAEANARDYRFDRTRIIADDDATAPPIEVTEGQLAFEHAHLASKLRVRDPGRLATLGSGAAVAGPVLLPPRGPAQWGPGNDEPDRDVPDN